jgi:hypothetical protein
VATRVLPLHTPVAVAGSTLVAAALFNPLRRRVQLKVDRRFNRARYDADQMVAAFAGRLKDTVNADSVRDDLAGVVHQAMEPTLVSVWVNDHWSWAEGVGFEPTVTLPPQWFSRPSPSATRRALQCVTAYGNAEREVSRRGRASPSPTIAARARYASAVSLPRYSSSTSAPSSRCGS